MVKNLSCVSHGSLKRFPHKFTTTMQMHPSLLMDGKQSSLK